MSSASPTSEPSELKAHTGLDFFDPSELSPMSEWRELSDGGYSEVYKAWLLGTPVAVKQATSRKKTSGEALLREIRYLRMAGPHPNIVQAYGAFWEHGKLHLVMQYARQCLRSDRVARQCDPIVLLAGVARALVRLHSLGIVHRDLKARNVLVGADSRAVLIDFGLACHLDQDDAEWVSRTVGTKKYRPPEMREGRPAQPALDIYCFGLMVEKLLRQRRERPSADESPRSDSGRHERRDCRLLQELGAHCLRDPAERPSAWEILVRLQRHLGEDVRRCDAARKRVPLSAPLPPAAVTKLAERAGEEEYGSGGSRKRRRKHAEADGDRHADGGSSGSDGEKKRKRKRRSKSRSRSSEAHRASRREARAEMREGGEKHG